MSAIRLREEEATALCNGVFARAGFATDEAAAAAASLVDAQMCGYPALGLARALTIVEDPRSKLPKHAIVAEHETLCSALLNGGNRVGPFALQQAARIAVEKATASGVAVVGLHNTYLSGRSAYYLEAIARAGFACLHTASSAPFVVAPDGQRPVLGTNPLAIGIPREPDPLLFDMGTSAITHGEVVLADRLGQALPAGVAVDSRGQPTQDASAAVAGGILPLAGHKGFGLALMIQALGLLAGAASPEDHVTGYGFLFLVFSPGLLGSKDTFPAHLDALLDRVRTSGRDGAAAVRLPSERSWRTRERARREGMLVDTEVYARLTASAHGTQAHGTQVHGTQVPHVG